MTDERLRKLEREWSVNRGDPQAAEAYCAELLRGVGTRLLVEALIRHERALRVFVAAYAAEGSAAQSLANVHQAMITMVNTADIIDWLRRDGEPWHDVDQAEESYGGPRESIESVVACPECGVPAGEHCRMMDEGYQNIRLLTPHMFRLRAYHQHEERERPVTTYPPMSMTVERLREARAEVRCPDCEAQPGEPCVLPGMRDVENTVHTSRMILWRRHHVLPQWHGNEAGYEDRGT